MTSIATRFGLSALCGAAVIGLGACQTHAPSINKEDLLSSAGFKMRLADTPAKMASLERLPPLKFVHKDLNGHVLTLYADPAGCKCLFVGDQTAWQKYQEAVLQTKVILSTEEQAEMSNQVELMNADATWGWDPWGPVATWDAGWGP